MAEVTPAVQVYLAVFDGRIARFPHRFFEIKTSEGKENARQVLRYAIENVLNLIPDETLPETLTVRDLYKVGLCGLVAKLEFSQGKILSTAYPEKRYVSRDELRERRLKNLKIFLSHKRPIPPPYPAEIQEALDKHFGGSIGVALKSLFPDDDERYFLWLGRHANGHWNDAQRCILAVREMIENHGSLKPENFWDEKLSTLLAVFGGNAGLAKFVALQTAEAEALVKAANPNLDLYRDWPVSVNVLRQYMKEKQGRRRLRFPRETDQLAG